MRIFVSLLVLFSLQVFAEVYEFDSLEDDKRFRELLEHLRCTVCQNQNLADSHAPLAADLRDVVVEKIAEGMSNDEIKEFMNFRR